MSTRAQSPEKDVAFTVTANIAMVAVSMITGPLVARLLGPSGRGELGVIQAWPLLVASLAQLGQSEAIVYFSSRNPTKIGEYMITGTLIALVGSAVMTGLTFVALPWLLSGPNFYLVHAARSYLWLVPLWVVVNVPSQAMRQSGRLLIWNCCRFLPIVGWAAIVGTAQLKDKTNAMWLTHAHLLVLAFLVPVILLITVRQIGVSLRASRKSLAPMTRFGMLSCLGTTSNLLNQRLDQLVIALLLPAAPIGLYAAGGGWASGFGTAITAISLVALPRVASRDPRESTETFLQWVRASAIVIFSGVAILLAVTPFAFPLLFGNAFRPAISCSAILLVGAAVSGFNLVIEDGLRALGHPQSVLIAETAGWLSMFVAVAAVVSRGSLALLAGASLTGYLVATAVLFLQIEYKLGPSLKNCRPTTADAKLVLNRGRLLIQELLQSATATT